jgi:REP element-mobilizing transposase RayT
MARKLRLQYPGALYHVMNRGDRREPIFRDDRDRRLLLETLGESCEKTDWLVHAWCLMSNHFLKTVCDYVHLNPARAKLLRARDKLADFRWSSYCVWESQNASDRLVTRLYDAPHEFNAVMQNDAVAWLNRQLQPAK